MPAVMLTMGMAFVLALALILALRLRPAPRRAAAIAIVPQRSFVPCLSLDEALDTRLGPLASLQLHLLRWLRSAGEKGIPLAKLRPVHSEFARRYPELYDGCDFEQWLRFFDAAGLMAISGHTAWLGPEGLRLLEHSGSERFAA